MSLIQINNLTVPKKNLLEGEKVVGMVDTIKIGQCFVDCELITGDSPDAADNLGKLAAPLLVKYAIENDK